MQINNYCGPSDDCLFGKGKFFKTNDFTSLGYSHFVYYSGKQTLFSGGQTANLGKDVYFIQALEQNQLCFPATSLAYSDPDTDEDFDYYNNNAYYSEHEFTEYTNVYSNLNM